LEEIDACNEDEKAREQTGKKNKKHKTEVATGIIKQVTETREYTAQKNKNIAES